MRGKEVFAHEVHGASRKINLSEALILFSGCKRGDDFPELEQPLLLSAFGEFRGPSLRSRTS